MCKIAVRYLLAKLLNIIVSLCCNLLSFVPLYWCFLSAADKDETKGSGWERFEFDKDAPLDDEEIEGWLYFHLYAWPG